MSFDLIFTKIIHCFIRSLLFYLNVNSVSGNLLYFLTRVLSYLSPVFSVLDGSLISIITLEFIHVKVCIYYHALGPTGDVHLKV